MNRLFTRTSTGTIAQSDGIPPSGIIHSIFATCTAAGSCRVQDAGGSVDFTILMQANDTTVLNFQGLAYSGTLTLTLSGTAPKAWIEIGA